MHLTGHCVYSNIHSEIIEQQKTEGHHTNATSERQCSALNVRSLNKHTAHEPFLPVPVALALCWGTRTLRWSPIDPHTHDIRKA